MVFLVSFPLGRGWRKIPCLFAAGYPDLSWATLRCNTKEPEIMMPKQAILAQMVEQSSDELWDNLCVGVSRTPPNRRNIANILRRFSDDELGAVVIVSKLWSGSYKYWESQIVRSIMHRVDTDEWTAYQLFDKLEHQQFLVKATDIDYSRQPQQAYRMDPIVLLFGRLARRSGLFLNVYPPPFPESLSALLVFPNPVAIHPRSVGWYAANYGRVMRINLENYGVNLIHAFVARHEPERTWLFISREDKNPKIINETFTLLSSSTTGKEINFDDGYLHPIPLEKFDDLGMLK